MGDLYYARPNPFEVAGNAEGIIIGAYFATLTHAEALELAGLLVGTVALQSDLADADIIAKVEAASAAAGGPLLRVVSGLRRG